MTELVDASEMMTKYHKYVVFKLMFIVACIIAMVIVMGYAATIGSANYSAWDVYRDIWYHFVDPGQNNPKMDHVIFDIRLPRIMTGLVAGMSLGVAGAAMQSMMKNPLADPYTTGISSGALFGATLAMTMGIFIIDGLYGRVLNAFVFAMVPALFITLLSRWKKPSPAMMILVGIAIMYIFNAFQSYMMSSSSMALPDTPVSIWARNRPSMSYTVMKLPLFLSQTERYRYSPSVSNPCSVRVSARSSVKGPT